VGYKTVEPLFIGMLRELTQSQSVTLTLITVPSSRCTMIRSPEGLAEYCSPRHRMPFFSRHEGSCVSMTRQTISARPYLPEVDGVFANDCAPRRRVIVDKHLTEIGIMTSLHGECSYIGADPVSRLNVGRVRFSTNYVPRCR